MLAALCLPNALGQKRELVLVAMKIYQQEAYQTPACEPLAGSRTADCLAGSTDPSSKPTLNTHTNPKYPC